MNSEKTSHSNHADGAKRRFYEDLWEIDISSLSRLRRLGVNFMRIIVPVLRGFRENECPLHAAALTLGWERLNPAIRHVLGKMDAGVAGVLGSFSITDLLQLHARLEQSPLNHAAIRR